MGVMMNRILLALIVVVLTLACFSVVSAAEPIGGDQGWILVYCNVNGAQVYFDSTYEGVISEGMLYVPVYSTGTPIKSFTVSKSGYTTYTGSIPTMPAPGQTIVVYATLNPVTPDVTPPTITITSPTAGQKFTTAIVTVSGIASDNVGLSKVEVKVGSGAWQIATGTSSWSKSVTLASGSNKITARATDTSGNYKDTTVTVTYKKDVTPPTITIKSPKANQKFTTATITVSGIASDNVGLSKVEVKVGSGAWQTATGTTSWSTSVTLASGSNKITARATDTAGNTKDTSVTVTYTFSNTLTVSSISPTSGGEYATVGVTITGTNFESGATAKLTRAGYPSITAKSISVYSATSIGCYFDLDSDSGSYNVVVTNPGGQSATKTGAFSIVAYQPANIEMIGNVYGLAAVPANGIDEIQWSIGLAPGCPTMDLTPMKIVFSTPTTTTKILSQGTTASVDVFTTKDSYNGTAVTTLSPEQQVNINFKVAPVPTNTEMNFEIRPSVGASLPFTKTTPVVITGTNVLY